MDEGTFYFEYQPQRWPLSTPVRLHSIERDGTKTDLLCFPDGHLALIIESGRDRREHHFQRVSIQEGAVVKFCFSWGQNGASAAAGGAMLSSLEESDGEVMILNIKERPSYEMGHMSVSRELIKRASRDEWLFLESLADMTRKLESASRYDLVRLSALLRQLLCDNPPLAQVVSRKFRLDIHFEVAIKQNQAVPEPQMLRTSWRSLYPNTQEEIARVDRDRFLKLRTIMHEGVDCTVGDVIDVVAHAFGGVHYGQLWSDENRSLAILENEVLIHDESLVLHSLLDIGKVTVKAFIPLAEAIMLQLGEA